MQTIPVPKPKIGALRINPVTGTLATARPIKDPRLARLQAATVPPMAHNGPETEKATESDTTEKPGVLVDSGKIKSLPRIPKTTKSTDTTKPTRKDASAPQKSEVKKASPEKAKGKHKKVSPKSSKVEPKKDSTLFKPAKGSKSRNYVKRGSRLSSLSPEPSDVDLREKQTDKSKQFQGSWATFVRRLLCLANKLYHVVSFFLTRTPISAFSDVGTGFSLLWLFWVFHLFLLRGSIAMFC